MKKIAIILYNIKVRRQKLGYTQEYVADQLNMSQYAYYKIESGKTQLKIKVLLQIIKVLQISFDELTKEP